MIEKQGNDSASRHKQELIALPFLKFKPFESRFNIGHTALYPAIPQIQVTVL